ncbi:hypothetical protein CVT24_013288 [Panaeolus cyanescens]|uniref:Uncharacterized protein n=1 Tax=Panaeolus cyanescens TaxID=181874 RepID=A0A409VW53_9AGAR|nr:hypothetical protein CVT24_013288 [Panaeolus cyanescens]
MPSNLENILGDLRIPTEFTRVNTSVEPDLVSLHQWRDKVSNVLEQVRTLAQSAEHTLDQRADLMLAVAPFGLSYQAEITFNTAEWEPWRSEALTQRAKGILDLAEISSPSKQLVVEVLVKKLKPVFRANAHPHINPSTGRKLSTMPTDPLAMQDYFESQKWKGIPGIDKVVLCGSQTSWYEELWHLLVPPIMAFLDDYEVNYKLRGVLLVQEMLAKFPKDLLRRTGIDDLLRTSLRGCLSHLDYPMSPDLIRQAVGTSVTLIVETSGVGTISQPSSQRFDELCGLLGEGIISGIWMYSEDKPNIVRATFDSIPGVMRALGIGSVRFLQALIPQFTHALKPIPLLQPDRQTQKSAINVLSTTIDVCAPRIPYWQETILDAVGRCWVAIVDEERENGGLPEDALEIKEMLKQLCKQMAEKHPQVKDDYRRLLEADVSLFQDLFLISVPAANSLN